MKGHSKWLIVTDTHGCAKTLFALIKKHGKGRQLILLGDLIDRGPRSREVVEYAMKRNAPTVMGNHEDLALAYSAHAKMGYRAKASQYYDRDVWLANGGRAALESWNAKTLPKDVLDWMANLPPYIVIDTPNAQGRKLLCSHTGYGLDADKGNWLRTLWGRYPTEGAFMYEEGTGKEIDDGLFRAFGHTREREVEMTDTYVNLDTGCAYEGYGKMSALLWPECTTVTIDNID